LTALNHGRTLGSDADGEELQKLMAGGKDLQALSAALGGTV
jgi:hypothetical protein